MLEWSIKSPLTFVFLLLLRMRSSYKWTMCTSLN